MNHDKLHEEEVVVLASREKRKTLELARQLHAQGFALHEDVWSLDRKGRVPPWQHGSIVELDVMHGSVEVYDGDDDEWDRLRLRYLFASLPEEHISMFIGVVWSLAELLSLAASLNEEPIDRPRLVAHFDRCLADLRSGFDEYPGSESLAILIQSTYPR